MATRTRITTEYLSMRTLAELLREYWENQPAGLVVGDNKNLDASKIREGLCELNNDKVEVSDEEIAEAHRVLMEDWLELGPRFVKNYFEWHVEWAGPVFPHEFKIIFQARVVKENTERDNIPQTFPFDGFPRYPK